MTNGFASEPESDSYPGSRNVGATELAVTASLEAIEKSGVDRADIDLVIVGTVSNTRVTPSISAVISDLVGVNPAAAYDSNAACAGFAYAARRPTLSSGRVPRTMP